MRISVVVPVVSGSAVYLFYIQAQDCRVVRGSAVVLAVLLSALYLCTELCSLVRISVVVPVVSRSAVYLLRI